MPPRRPFPHASYALLRLGDGPADACVFGDRSGRAGGALGTAVATHAVIAAALWTVAGIPDRVQPPASAVTAAMAPFVFTHAAGEGTGQSGGGNRSPQPAPLLRTRGADAIAVSTSAPRTPAAPETIGPEAEPTPALPVQAMNTGELPQLGAVDGVPVRPRMRAGRETAGSAPEPAATAASATTAVPASAKGRTGLATASRRPT